MQRPTTILVLTVALGACVAENGDEGIFITKNVAPGEGCSFAASSTSPFIAHGTFSINSPSAYQLHPQMKSRVTAAEGQTDARTVIVRGARIELSFADPSLFSTSELDEMRSSGITRFETRFTAPLPPNGGLADGDVDMIQTSLLDRLIAKNPAIANPGGERFRAEVIASVRVFGDMSGNEITSQEFQYPVTICNDCVTNILGACPLPAGTDPALGNACNPYQDGVVDCCSQGNDIICPPSIASP